MKTGRILNHILTIHSPTSSIIPLGISRTVLQSHPIHVPLHFPTPAPLPAAPGGLPGRLQRGQVQLGLGVDGLAVDRDGQVLQHGQQPVCAGRTHQEQRDARQRPLQPHRDRGAHRAVPAGDGCRAERGYWSVAGLPTGERRGSVHCSHTETEGCAERPAAEKAAGPERHEAGNSFVTADG